MDISMAQISPVNMKERADLGIKPGDTTRVWIKVQEKGKTRLQPFEGLVLARKHGSEPGATFTVRKVASGVGIEKIFPLYSPNIDKIEIVRRAKVRRAKLYYIRDKAAREIRRQMRNMKLVQISTQSDIAEKEAAVKADKEAKQKAVEGAEAVAQQKEVKEKKEEKSISAKEAELQSEETEDSKVEASVEEKKT